MVEIEIKIPDTRSVLEMARQIHEALVVPGVQKLLTSPLIFAYEDRYFDKEGSSSVRIRTSLLASFDSDFEEKVGLVTTKIKSIQNGVEVNNETERRIPLAAALGEIQETLDQGYVDIGYVKTKTGMCYKFADDITINAEAVFTVRKHEEDTEIHSVGRFFEIEKLLNPNAIQKEVQTAQDTVLSIAATLGLELSKIETRSWRDLCALAQTKEKEKI